MKIVLFCHSLLSDWNHGNAHFLRGVATELVSRGNHVRVYEPRNAWSLTNLLTEHGTRAVAGFRKAYPALRGVDVQYDIGRLDLDVAIGDADLVIVHEWTDPKLIARIGRQRARGGKFKLLFHDTHHRAATDPQAMAACDLSNYDGVLAFGEVLRDLYLKNGWTQRAWIWHEAADVRRFHPIPGAEQQGDLVWIGNWGDGERTGELREFLIDPVKSLRLKARIHGVRYPESALAQLAAAEISYGGWAANFTAPTIFSGYKVTVHVPRRPYSKALPGIPTIRMFEALACGIPLVSAPWSDVEGLFTPGEDYLVARNGREMKSHLRLLVNDPEAAEAVAEHGLRTIRSRHTCAHRVDELMNVVAELTGTDVRAARPARRRPRKSAAAATA